MCLKYFNTKERCRVLSSINVLVIVTIFINIFIMKNLNLKRLILLVGIVSLSTLNSCLNDDNYVNQNSIDDKLIQDYLKENNIEATKNASGFYYSVLEPNSSGSEIKEKDIISVYYKINTLNGDIIDEVKESSGEPKRIKISNNSIIPNGMLIGSVLMKEGERFRFYLPSRFAYSSYSYKSLIPNNAILIVESKISKIDSEDDQKQFEKIAIETYITDNNLTNFSETDSGVFYKKIEDGTGDNPIIDNRVKIKYVAKYFDGTVFSKTETNKTFDFEFGSNNIIKGVNESVKLMQKGEKSTFIIPSHLAYNSSLQIFPEEIREDLLEKGIISQKIPPFSNLIFDIELVDVN